MQFRSRALDHIKQADAKVDTKKRVVARTSTFVDQMPRRSQRLESKHKALEEPNFHDDDELRQVERRNSKRQTTSKRGKE